jgi:2-polyprenyl-3-methyl-5-hydroxy-6-metoxy-1,4-benzoquinol methylase
MIFRTKPPAYAHVPTAFGRDMVPPPDNKGKRIGILIVAYNAVTTLAGVLKRIHPDVWANVEDVVVFDDASHDATYELALGYKTAAGLDKLTVIRNSRNRGYGGNLKQGFRYFIEKGFDIVILLHGDGQYAPEILPCLYAPLVSGQCDAVFGSRMLPSAYGSALKGGMPLYKYVGNKILSRFENRALGMNLSEFHSGYRAYSLAALRQIDLSKTSDDFHFDTEIIIKLNHQGFRIREVPIPTYYGREICYVNGNKYALNVIKAVIHYWRTIRSVACYPEYAEYFVHYPLKESKYSSHYFFLGLVGKDKEVLDIGCGEGFFAATLTLAGNRVTGIDILPEAKHASKLEKYIRADLDTAGLQEALGQLADRQFDSVLLQDILEHVRSPEKLLHDCLSVMKSNGKLFVSLPNIANITVRASLLLGHFNYSERGILDKTHLHFYTPRTGRQLLEEAGFEILHKQMTAIPVDVAMGLSARNPLTGALTRCLTFLAWLLPGIFGYQMIFIARRRQSNADD